MSLKERAAVTGKSILIGALIMGSVLGLGWFGVYYKSTVGQASRNADHQVFKNSTAYVDGMASDLADFQLQLMQEQDPTARKAIINVILERYSNFDETKLESKSLREFLVDVRNGNIQ
jgi:hypothetical protein